MVIVQKYVIKEILQVFIAVLVILVLIYVSNRFIRYLADAAAGTLSSTLIFELLALKLLAKASFLLPMALYVAVLLGLGRLYKDSEVVAMISGGIGVATLAKAILWLACAMALLVSVMAFYVSPKVSAMQAELLAKAKEESEITGIYPGRFKVFKNGEQTVYVEEVSPDGRRMEKIFIVSRKDKQEHVLVAQSAYQKLEGSAGQRYIILEDGHRYSGRPGELNYVVTRFDRHAILLDLGRAQPSHKRGEAFSTMELIASDSRRLKGELHWRISLPISVLLLSMLAIPLAQTSPRQGKYAKLFTAFLIYFAYNNAVGVFQKLVERGDVHPIIGIWPVHLVMVLIVATLLVNQTAAPGFIVRVIKQTRRRWR